MTTTDILPAGQPPARTPPAGQRAAAAGRAAGGRSVADVAERLMWEYGGLLSLATISSTVLAAARDLVGEVPPAALTEMLYRLARQRLAAEPDGGAVRATAGS